MSTAQTHDGPNGTAYILGQRAQALAHYPHMRRAGGMLYVSGISSRRPDNSVAGADDIRAQTQAVIENIKAVLGAAGADLSHVVSITTYLVNMEDYSGYNEVYNQYFTAASGPARTTVAVAQLPGPQLLIEMTAIAVAP
jgi:2-aminomuconate deaminase